MRWFDSIQRRIVVAYALLALGSAAFFTLIAALAVEGIEVHLVDDRLKSVADWASPRHAAGLPVGLPSGIIFYHGESIPPSLRGLAPGIQERIFDGVDMHLLAGTDAAGDYVVVDRESEYEKIEMVVYSMIAAGVMGFLVLSLVLARFLGRKLVMPLARLATAVSEPEPDAGLPYLSNADEIGVLARAFADRTAELRAFLDRERLFTGDVSHELRTSLTIISGAAELLAAKDGGDPAVRASAQRILRAAAEATESINVLLTLARAPDRIDTPRTPLSPLIQREVERCRSLLGGKPLEISFRQEADVSVHANPELMAAAIGNLVRNACQYTAQGSVVVRLTAGAVVVEDTGPGIPADVHARSFEPSNPSARIDSTGPGLGLGLVRRICDRLGFGLRAELRAGGGSSVRIEFPT